MTTTDSFEGDKMNDIRTDKRIVSRVERISPEIARLYLEKNHPNNRVLMPSRVSSIAHDMKAEQWKLTHQGIAFDGEDLLIDGQHRLHAVIMADVTVEMLVIRNTGAGFHDPIDRSAPRTVAFLTGIDRRRAATYKILYAFEQGHMPIHTFTVSECQEMITHHGEILEELLQCTSGMSRIPASFVGVCAWAYPIDPNKTLEFARAVATGEMLHAGDPALQLRQWFDRNRGRMHDVWKTGMASANAARYALGGLSCKSIHTTVDGYRVLTTRRRALDVPNTPDADAVQTRSIRWDDNE
jgi:hypothetical protein